MMFYYIDTIEQVDAAPDSGWTVNEYGARTIYKDKTIDEVRAIYFKKISDVSNDLKAIGEDKHHYYMDIKLINSAGGIEEKRQLGTRVEPEHIVESETTEE